LSVGCLLLSGWLVVLIVTASGMANWAIGTRLLEGGALLAIVGILFGGLLDLLALRKTRLM